MNQRDQQKKLTIDQHLHTLPFTSAHNYVDQEKIIIKEQNETIVTMCSRTSIYSHIDAFFYHEVN